VSPFEIVRPTNIHRLSESGARELEAAEKREHDTRMFTRDEVRILKAVHHFELETKLVDVPSKLAEQCSGGEAVVGSLGA